MIEPTTKQFADAMAFASQFQYGQVPIKQFNNYLKMNSQTYPEAIPVNQKPAEMLFERLKEINDCLAEINTNLARKATDLGGYIEPLSDKKTEPNRTSFFDHMDGVTISIKANVNKYQELVEFINTLI